MTAREDSPSNASDSPDQRGRILVAVAGDGVRESIAESLRAYGHDVVVEERPRPDQFDGVDLWVTDTEGLVYSAGSVAQERADRGPELLPTLLVAGEDDPGLDDVDPTVVDEVIRFPARRGELRRRVTVLLRSRRYSVALEERRRQYRRLVGLAPDGVALLVDGTVRYANRVMRGFVAGEADSADGITLVDREFMEFVPPADRERVGSTLDDVAAGRDGNHAVRTSLAPLSGPAFETEVAAVRVPYDGGFATQLVVRDVTDRNRRERQVRLFGRAMEEASVGITIADVTQYDDPLVYVNRAFESITGYESGEIVGENCRFLQGPGTDPATVAEIRAAIDAGEPLRTRIRNYRKDGAPFWNELELTPVENDRGEVTHYLGFQRDVTDQEQRQRALLEYETIFSAAGEPIYSLDGSGRFTNVNDALCSLVGYDESELLGAHASLVLDEADVEACETLIADLHSGDADSGTVEVTVETAAGGRRRCLVTIGALPPDADGSLPGTVGVVRDVTETRQREQQLAVMDRILRHDIRNTMNVIQGRLEMIEPSDPQEAEHISEVLDVSASLLDLSEDARQFHQVFFDGDQTLGAADLVDRTESVLSSLRDRYPAAHLTLEAPDRAPVVVHGGVDVVVEELVENAVVHNDREHPNVAVSIRPDGDVVDLVVEDDGPGVPHGERVTFDGDVESALDHASGLGLWLVTWIVDASGGSIDCTDDGDRGTRMTVTFQSAEDGDR